LESNSRKETVPITVVVPTYGREQILLNTLQELLRQDPVAAEILVVDQTSAHEPETERELNALQKQGRISWIHLSQPSQPAALNRGLMQATQPIVLFIDDDLELESGFLAAHLRCFEDESVWAVAGQVLQPNQEELKGIERNPASGRFSDLGFPFNSAKRVAITNAMSGNLSVRRDRAIAIGGFDENFLPPVSYRFDAEFCKRLCRHGGTILFEPSATIYHLRCPQGGTRTIGSHLASASPIHGVGDYYFALRQGISRETFLYMLRRPLREVSTRFHLKHPWWIPVKILGELRALFRAVVLYVKGPRYLYPGPK
jgi:GT2 family glycosyltransferase